MRAKLLILALYIFAVIPAMADVEINEANFPDERFRNWVLSQSYGQDGVLTEAEIKSISNLTIPVKSNIQSLKGIEYFVALNFLGCDFNQLTSLDVSQNKELIYLFCTNNQLETLDLSKNTKLRSLTCYCNNIKSEGMDGLVASLPANSDGSGLMRVVWSQGEHNAMTTTQVAAAKAKGWTPQYYDGSTWLDYEGNVEHRIEINETNFPDKMFRSFLLSQAYGQDGYLSDSEIQEVKSMDVNVKEIQSLKGIEFFTALTELECGWNNLTSLDLSQNPHLIVVQCNWCKSLKSLDVSKNTALKELYCSINELTTLDISNNSELSILFCLDNQLTSLDVSKNTALKSLSCCWNLLKELDLSHNVLLQDLSCHSNQLTSLVLPKNSIDLTQLECYGNQIKGESMDALVESLPNTTNGVMEVVHNELEQVNELEQNVMTTTQVTAAKAKGWMPMYFNNGDWQPYDGSEPSGIEHIAADMNAEKALWYDLTGRVIKGKPTQRGVYIHNRRKTVVK